MVRVSKTFGLASWAVFTPSSLPRDLRPLQKSSITYHAVWCRITHPWLKKDEACGFCSDRLIKMDSTSMAGGQMTTEQWTNTGMNTATDILPIRGTCLGVACLRVLVSQDPCCDLVLFICTALPSVSWPLAPKPLSSGAGAVLNLDLGSSDAFLVCWPHDPSQPRLEASASLWRCPHLTHLLLLFLLSSIHIYFFSFLWLIWMANVLLISSICILLPMCFISAGWSLDRRWVNFAALASASVPQDNPFSRKRRDPGEVWVLLLSPLRLFSVASVFHPSFPCPLLCPFFPLPLLYWCPFLASLPVLEHLSIPITSSTSFLVSAPKYCWPLAPLVSACPFTSS